VDTNNETGKGMSFWDEITVLSVSYNTKDIIASSLEPFLGAKEIIVVDNASQDQSVEYIKQTFPQVTLIENDLNLGYGGGFNTGLAHVKTPYLFAISPDTEITPAALEELYNALKSYEGAALVSPALEVPRQGIEMWIMGPQELGHRLSEVPCDGPFSSWFSSAAITLYRTNVIKEVGGFDENIFLYQEDLDLALRITKAGYSMVNMPNILAHHMNSGSTAPSVSQHWRKDWNLAWGSLYVLEKHGPAGAARAKAWKLIMAKAPKALFYALVLDRKRLVRDFAVTHGAVSFLLGKTPKRRR
jgi:N-acetylglucosaminyl-diphospho-decaprenol L-rhamnosyltransferase